MQEFLIKMIKLAKHDKIKFDIEPKVDGALDAPKRLIIDV